MLYHGTFPQVTRKFFLLCYMLCMAIVICCSGILYHAEISRAEQQRKYVAKFITNHIEEQHALAVRTLHHIASLITASGGSSERVREIIDQEVNQKSLPLRIAWSDVDMQLAVGTAISVFGEKARQTDLKSYRLDLSDREYVQQARTQPGTIYISGLLHHKITGRPFYAISLGVEGRDGRYLGSLATIVDRNTLAQFIESSIQGTELQGTFLLPNGDIVFSTPLAQPNLATKIVRGGYRMHLQVNPDYRVQLLYSYLTISSTVILLISLVFLAVYHVFANSLVRPISDVLHLLFGIRLVNGCADSPAIAMHALLPRIQVVRDQVERYDSLNTKLEEREDMLLRALDALRSIRQEYFTTLGSMGKELQQAFYAIDAYGELCKTGGVKTSDEAYSAHGEVEEFGLNMKFLANALYLLCQANSGELSLHPELRDISHYIDQSLHNCWEVVDDKHVEIRYTGTSCLFYHDEALLRHMIDGVIFTVWRFMEYASKAVIDMNVTEDGLLSCRVHIKQLDNLFIPGPERDAGIFIPSRRKVPTPEIARYLEGHINIKMLRLLSLITRGEVTLVPDGNTGLYLTVTVLRADLTPQ